MKKSDTHVKSLGH